MQVITSKDNEIIKNIRKLKDKKYREIENKYNTIEQKLLYEIAKYNCVYVAEKVFESITEVNNPQGMLAVVNKENKEEDIDYNEDMIVVLDGIQDPRKFRYNFKNSR